MGKTSVSVVWYCTSYKRGLRKVEVYLFREFGSELSKDQYTQGTTCFDYTVN